MINQTRIHDKKNFIFNQINFRNLLHALFINDHWVGYSNGRSSIKHTDIICMEMIKNINSSSSVENISGCNDMTNSFDSVEQHAEELDEQNNEEENNENKVDRVERHIGCVWYNHSLVERHGQDGVCVLTEHPVKGEGRGVQGGELHQEYSQSPGRVQKQEQKKHFRFERFQSFFYFLLLLFSILHWLQLACYLLPQFMLTDIDQAFFSMAYTFYPWWCIVAAIC